MIQTGMALFLLVVHLAVCLTLCLLVYFEVLNVKGYFLPFLVLVPVWGPLCVILLHTRNVLFGNKTSLPPLERLQVNEELYRSVYVENRSADSSTIPIEEALIINESPQRRRLIMSVLNDSPEEYIDLLQQARLNDDTEVVHYASTAMAQISKEADLSLQKYEQHYAADPDDPDVLEEYCDYLEQYLSSGLAQGRMAEIQRRQYAALLQKRIQKKRSYRLSCRLVQVQLVLGDYDAADQGIEAMIARWPYREDAWLLRLQSAAARKDSALLRETVRQIVDNKVYLSSKGREALLFWQGSKEESFQE